MKTTLTCSLLFICLCTLSCKKSSTTEKTTKEKLVAKWNVVSIYEIAHVGGVSDTTTAIVLPTNYYWDFQSSGVLIENNNGASTSDNYSIVSDTQIKLFSVAQNYDLKTLTDTDLELYSKVVSSSTLYYEYKAAFKKQ